MGFLNKVKNLFFEEEIIEVEEKPKKVKKDVPVAKKIELPKVERVEKIENESHDEKVDNRDLTEDKKIEMTPVKENKFPMDFNAEDFKEEPQNDVMVSRRSDRRKNDSNKEDLKEKNNNTIEEEFEEIKEEKETNYDFDGNYSKDDEEIPHLYEGGNKKKTFTPTPIISPIYGILDKNYKKDDVVTKKEVRLSSAPKKLDLDSVREKAYGDLTSDITKTIDEVKEEKYDDDLEKPQDEDLLYDLNDESSPAVRKVTVGDAEEYFNDLGLEYNIDYKDTSLEKSRLRKKEETVDLAKKEELPQETEENDQDNNIVDSEEDGIESNLFDLIESMYDEKE